MKKLETKDFTLIAESSRPIQMDGVMVRVHVRCKKCRGSRTSHSFVSRVTLERLSSGVHEALIERLEEDALAVGVVIGSEHECRSQEGA